MKLRELKQQLDSIPEEYGDADVDMYLVVCGFSDGPWYLMSPLEKVDCHTTEALDVVAYRVTLTAEVVHHEATTSAELRDGGTGNECTAKADV